MLWVNSSLQVSCNTTLQHSSIFLISIGEQMAACTNCKSDIQVSANVCPICGERNPTRHSIENPAVLLFMTAVVLVLASVVYLSPGFLYNYFVGKGFPSKENIKTAQFWVVIVVFWVIVYLTGFLAAEFEDAGKHIPTIAYLVLCVLISVKAKKIQNFLESKNIN